MITAPGNFLFPGALYYRSFFMTKLVGQIPFCSVCCSFVIVYLHCSKNALAVMEGWFVKNLMLKQYSQMNRRYLCREAISHRSRKSDTLLITHRYKLEDIEEAYHIFKNKLDGLLKLW